MPSGPGAGSFPRPPGAHLLEPCHDRSAVGAVGRTRREERPIVPGGLGTSPLAVEHHGEIAVGLGMPRCRAERPAESLDASRLIDCAHQTHTAAAPGLGIGRVNLDRFSDSDHGCNYLTLIV